MLRPLFVSVLVLGAGVAHAQSLHSAGRSISLVAVMPPKPALEAVTVRPENGAIVVRVNDTGPCTIDVERAGSSTTVLHGWCSAEAPAHTIELPPAPGTGADSVQLSIRVVTGRGDQVRVVTLDTALPPAAISRDRSSLDGRRAPATAARPRPQRSSQHQ